MPARPEFPPITDPRLAKVLIRYREAVARAAEQAYRDLDRLGYGTLAVDPLRVLIPQRRAGIQQSDIRGPAAG